MESQIAATKKCHHQNHDPRVAIVGPVRLLLVTVEPVRLNLLQIDRMGDHARPGQLWRQAQDYMVCTLPIDMYLTYRKR
ncbi:MAG: hypothetical protein FalmKO_01500 [Falsiruegeria mediterranea]